MLITVILIIFKNEYFSFPSALGMGQSCFEGAMYTFVFMWTPALKSVEEAAAEASGHELKQSTSQYLGTIFAVFMVCTMYHACTLSIHSILMRH